MRFAYVVIVISSMFLSSHLGLAQGPPAASPTNPSVTDTDRTLIESVLRNYETAYQNKTLDQLVQIWPDLPHQKDYKKIQKQFDEPNISNLQVTLEAQEWDVDKDHALLQCKRSERYDKLTQQYSNPALRPPSAVPMSAPPPVPEKKTVKKDDTVWITLTRTGTGWAIASMSDKKPK